jgi:hypothetical protein
MMRTISIGTGRAVSAIVAAAALAAIGAGEARADDAAALVGQWSGTILVQNRPIPLKLDVTSTALGAPSGSLHYGVPRSCQLELEYSGPAEAKYFFSFKRSNGGYCDQLIDGAIVVGARGDGLGFATMKRDGAELEHGTVRKQAN